MSFPIPWNYCGREQGKTRLLQSGYGLARTEDPIFTGAFGSRRNMWRIDQASELRKMTTPPLVRIPDCGAIDSDPGFQLVTPPAPVAIKRVHAVGHVHACINKRGSSQPVFLIQLKCSGHNASGKRYLGSVAELKIITTYPILLRIRPGLYEIKEQSLAASRFYTFASTNDMG
jgi:hypothetical protein